MNIASIDIGLKRIGFATCLVKNVILSAPAIIRKNRNQAAKEISQLLKEKNIELLVVGLPKGGNSEEEMGRRIKHFISLLEFGGKIVYQDEYGTSEEAKEKLKGAIKQKRDGKVDSIAASLILQRWIESGQSI